MLPSLPIEVIENVVDRATCDTQTLRTFALTCHKLLPRSRYNLFRFIRFQDVTQLHSFCNFLDLNPSVGSYVISLTLSTTPDNPKSLSLFQIIPATLLTRLPKLCRWKVTNPGTRDRKPRRWLSFYPLMLRYLRVYVTAIVELHLDSVSFPNCAQFVQYILAFRGLKTLYCGSVDFKAGLDDLRMYRVKQHLAVQLQLSTLIIGDDIADEAAVALLESSSSTLLDLELHIQKSTTLDIPAIVSELHRLESLTLALQVHTWDGGRNDDTQSELVVRTFQIIKALSRRPQSRLRNLTIRLHCTRILLFLDPLVNPASYPALECCRELEVVLLSLQNLRNIEIHHDGRYDFGSTSLLEEYLPTLARERSVTFKCLTPSHHRQAWASHDNWVQAVAVSPDSKRISSASHDQTIILWDTRRRSIIHEWIAHPAAILSLAFSPDSRRLASAGRDRRVIVWDISGSIAKRHAILEGHSDEVMTCAWSPDGTTLVSGGSDDGTVRIWDARTYQQLCSLRDPSGKHVRFVLFSPDGRWIVSGGMSTSCTTVWDATTSDLHVVLSDPPHNAVFDVATGRIATASVDNTVRIWDVETGEALVVLKGHTKWVRDVAFSPDGRRAVSGSSDKTVKVWGSFNGDLLLSLEAHTDYVTVVCFSPDGQHIASASRDTTVRLWGASDGSCIRTFTEHTRWIDCLEYSPDGETLITGGDDGRVCIRRLCDLIPEDPEPDGLVSCL